MAGIKKGGDNADTDMATKALESTSIANEALSIHLADGVLRPGYGSKGRALALKANSFAVNLPQMIVFRYDVTITPMQEDGDSVRPAPSTDKKLPTDLVLEIFEHTTRQMANLTAELRETLAFDGRKNAFTPKKLPFAEHTQLIDLAAKPQSTGAPGRPPRRRLFHVAIKEVNSTDMSIIARFCAASRQDVQAAGSSFVDSLSVALQSFEIALRHDRMRNYKIHGAGGRKFYDPSTAKPIANAAQIWHGFFQSARPTKMGLVINLDVAYSCFLGGGPFLQLAAEILGSGGGGGGGGRGGGRGGGFRGGRGGGGYGGGGGRGGRPSLTDMSAHEEQQLRRSLHGVMARATHRAASKMEKFKGFSGGSARQTQFRTHDGSDTTIEKYFKDTYNVILRYPHLKCAILGSSKNLVPLELVEIIGGTPIGPTRMTPSQVSDMIRESATRPHERLQRTKAWRSTLDYGKGDRVGKWGARIAMEPADVKGRVLESATVCYREGPLRSPLRNGSWDLRNARCIKSGKRLVNLVVINFTRAPPGQVSAFTENLMRQLAQFGVDVRNCKPYFENVSPDIGGLKDVLSECGTAAFRACDKRSPPQLFLCILPESNDVYKRIKAICARDLPTCTPSQCVIGSFKKAFTDRSPEKYCANVAMKINIKLGGANHVIRGERDLPKVGRNCMMVGVDVAHAAPGSDHPSVVSVVANSDGDFQSFWTELKTQVNPRLGQSQETILHGRQMYAGILNAWMKKNRDAVPGNVIFFRDGVSEGEYQKVVSGEIRQFFEACNDVKTGWKPKLAFIVCSKRHHVRFFATKDGDTDGRTGNLPPGTVVDNGVTHPYAHDFYLQSQAGLQGTARPGHYIVLRDQIGFTADEIQKLVYSICHMFARSTNTVSMPPMTMYAHHAADKARLLLYPDGEFSDTASQRSLDMPSGGHGLDLETMMDALTRNPGHPALNQFNETLWYM